MLGVIGGSGFYTFFDSAARSVSLDTPYGEPSAPVTVGSIGEHEVAFLPRHGADHRFPAHKVPYRANMWALRALGVRQIFAPCAVGSLTTDHGPGTIVVPDQLVDRTRRRADTYFDSGAAHVSFADPYCPTLRSAVTGLPEVVDGGTMVVIEGPRFSTRAESQMVRRRGLHADQHDRLSGGRARPRARNLLCGNRFGDRPGRRYRRGRRGESRRRDQRVREEHRAVQKSRARRDRPGRRRAACTECLSHTGVPLPFDEP